MTDTEIINCMVENGGGFVSALGQAARKADAQNLERLKRAWPEYWLAYGVLAERLAAIKTPRTP